MTLAPEMMMHFDRWAPLNLKSISYEQPTTVDGCLRYWDTRVERMRHHAQAPHLLLDRQSLV